MASIGFTLYARDQFLNLLRGIAASVPAGMYAAAIVTNPAQLDVSDMVEVDSVAHPEYARQLITFDAPITVATVRKIVSELEEIWPDADASWGTIVAIALFDASTGGDCWYVHEVAASKSVDAGDTLRIADSKMALGFGNAA